MSRATTRAIGPADKKLIDNPDHDAHAAGLYRAMALRFYARYVDMRSHAEFRGGDLEGHGPLHTSLKASEQYQLAIEEWLWEPAETANATLALVEFAGVIAADKLLGEVLREGRPVSDERDAFHQTIALAAVSGRLNEHSMKEWLDRRQAAYGPSGMPCEEKEGASPPADPASAG
jgi:hypothetical protein